MSLSLPRQANKTLLLLDLLLLLLPLLSVPPLSPPLQCPSSPNAAERNFHVNSAKSHARDFCKTSHRFHSPAFTLSWGRLKDTQTRRESARVGGKEGAGESEILKKARKEEEGKRG